MKVGRDEMEERKKQRKVIEKEENKAGREDLGGKNWERERKEGIE